MGEGRGGLLGRAAGGTALSLAWALGSLPPPLGDAVGAGLGSLLYLVDAAHRRRAVENLLRAGMAADAAAARRMARAVFQNLGRSFADVCRIPLRTDAELAAAFRFEGYEHVREARARGRGVLLITAHLGAWELLPLASAIQGDPIHVVVRTMDNATLDRAITAVRTRGGNAVIRKQDLMRTGLRVLKGGGTIGILIDQNIAAREGVFVEFFGRTACATYAPALLALRTGSAVIPVTIVREAPGRHVVVVEEPLAVARSGNLRDDLQENTARFTRAIETFVRRSPTDWLWVHRRWKTQPPPPGEGAEALPPIPDGEEVSSAVAPGNPEAAHP
jgi:KDO2-lipid IV(A) lauroyltransferase